MIELQFPPGSGGYGPWDNAGTCTILGNDDGTLTVTQADARVLVSNELLDELRDGKHVPEGTLNGDIFRVEAANRTVCYRIGEKIPGMRGYFADRLD